MPTPRTNIEHFLTFFDTGGSLNKGKLGPVEVLVAPRSLKNVEWAFRNILDVILQKRNAKTVDENITYI